MCAVPYIVEVMLTQWSLLWYSVRLLRSRNLGSKGGTVVRALASYQCGPGANPGIDAICGLSLLLVLSLAPRGFSPGTPVFPSPQKPTFPNSNSTRNQADEEPLCGCATCKSLFIYLLFNFATVLYLGTVDSRYCGHPRDCGLVSVIARVRNDGVRQQCSFCI